MRLASEIRSGLTGITYVLDEPTVGPAPSRHADGCSACLRGLRDAGNTVVVVEHDSRGDSRGRPRHRTRPGRWAPTAARSSPGDRRPIAREAASKTGPHLSPGPVHPAQRPAAPVRPRVVGASAHNLRQLDVECLPAARGGDWGLGQRQVLAGVRRGRAPSVAAGLTPGDDASAPVACRELIRTEPFERLVQRGRPAAATSPWSRRPGRSASSTHCATSSPPSRGSRARTRKRALLDGAGKGGRCETCEGLGHADQHGLPA